MSGAKAAKVICGRNDPSAGWDRFEREGWIARLARQPRVVVQVGQADRSAAVLAAARSLAARLAQAKLRVEIVDRMATPNDWTGFTLRTLRDEKTLKVAAIAVPQGLVVPQLWCEPFALVTVTGIGTSVTSRVASILEAQAEPLVQLGNGGVPRALVYEAHRLCPSDLAVVCTADGTWAASAGDTALEQAVLHAAGIAPATAPHFRELLRHELPPPAPLVEGQLPSLRHFAAPEWQVRRAMLQSSMRVSSHVIVQDFRNLRGNLHKIPAFVRRRMATWRAQRGGK